MKSLLRMYVLGVLLCTMMYFVSCSPDESPTTKELISNENNKDKEEDKKDKDDDESEEPEIPSDDSGQVITGDVYNITENSATLNGSVNMKNGQADIVGFIIDEFSNLSITSNLKVIQVSPASSFSKTVSDLLANTKYYYRTFALYKDKYYYGEVKSFTTKDKGESSQIVATTGNATANAVTASITGIVSGASSTVEVGVIYGLSNKLTESEGQRERTTSQGRFAITLKGLMDDETYYYRVYAMVDGIYHLGEIRSFKTEQLTYTIDNRTFKMIRVEGGPNGDFSIMQTELPPNSDLIINGINVGRVNVKDDDVLLKTEYRSLIISIYQATGILFQMPTRTEWKYAASGGNKGHAFSYSGSNSADEVAWHKGNCNAVQDIAQKVPNELGLYDMSGNYSEVCYNGETPIFTKDYSTHIQGNLDVDGPICGGCWKDESYNCTVNSWIEGSSHGKINNRGTAEKNAFLVTTSTVRLIYYRDK